MVNIDVLVARVISAACADSFKIFFGYRYADFFRIKAKSVVNIFVLRTVVSYAAELGVVFWRTICLRNIEHRAGFEIGKITAFEHADFNFMALFRRGFR